MPTYSYACTECGNRFDVVQAFTDEALTTCRQCSGRLRKLFGSVGVVFKGSGFYRTDSRESTTSCTNGSAKSGSSSSPDTPSSSEKATASSTASSTDSSTASSTASSTSDSAKAAAVG